MNKKLNEMLDFCESFLEGLITITIAFALLAITILSPMLVILFLLKFIGG